LKIQFNSQAQEVLPKTSLLQLLQSTKQPQTGVAVAINNHVIPKNNWNDTFLYEDDTVLVVQATQGG